MNDPFPFRERLFADTTPEALRVYFDSLRRMSPSQRATRTFELIAWQRANAAAGVRLRHPDYDERQVHLAVTRLWIGDDLFREAFPGVDVKP